MSDLSVEVQYATDATGLPGRQELESWARRAVTEADTGPRERCALVIRVVGEAEGTDLNRRYRGREGATNVLSFPFEPPPLPGPDEGCATEDPDQTADWLAAQIGDLVICAPVVAREAAEQGKSPRAHWAHMVVHGCLHLLGYDHGQPADAARMERLETAILSGLGFPPPYEDIEGTHDELPI